MATGNPRPVKYILREAELKLFSEPKSAPLDRTRVGFVIEGHPQRKDLEQVCSRLLGIGSAPEIPWAWPLRKCRPTDDNRLDMRDYLIASLSDRGCPIALEGPGGKTIVGHAKDHLWPGCIYDVVLTLSKGVVSPPNMPHSVSLVNAYAVGFMKVGGFPLKLGELVGSTLVGEVA